MCNLAGGSFWLEKREKRKGKFALASGKPRALPEKPITNHMAPFGILGMGIWDEGLDYAHEHLRSSLSLLHS